MKTIRILIASMCMLVAGGMAGCSEPEISKVLKNYCDYMIDDCGGTSKYQTKKECDRYHKDLLSSTSDGNASACRNDIEDFFIALMENQMSHECSFTFKDSILDAEDQEMTSSTQNVLQCFMDHNIQIDVDAFIGGL